MRRLACIAILFATVLPAQWLHLSTPGIPRTADGRPNLNAPAPRAPDGKPDLSGLWTLNAGPGHVSNSLGTLRAGDVQPWAQKVYEERLGNLGRDDPWTISCLPEGPRSLIKGGGGPARIVQTPREVVILYDDLTYRQIFLDGRPLPKDPSPAWMGYSIGHWDGDTLVVESNGFNDRSWLDMGGHPHTEALRTAERFHRTSFGHMDVAVTFDDPKAYAKPWTISFGGSIAADTEMLEYVCNEDEKDRSHLVGRTDEEKKVRVPVETLSKYVGVYDTVSTTGTAMSARSFTITLQDGQLMIEMGGNGKLPMVPLSETEFSPRFLGTYEFVKDASGAFTRMVAHSTEGDVVTERRRNR
jgi:hypothetical protein